MGFASNGIRDAFEGQGEAGFVAWTYATHDKLEQVLQPGYFNSFSRMAPGDLVYVGTTPRPTSSPWVTQHQNTEIRRALLMVKGRGEDGILRMRLVHDYGRPDDPDAPLSAVKKSRGRPPKKDEAA